MACWCVVGCGAKGDRLAREPLSGMVKVDGQPLASGYLTFEPQAGQPTQSGGMIVNGAYNVPPAHGALPGAYAVAIFAAGEAPATTAEPGTPEYEAAVAAQAKTTQLIIPKKYNLATELKAEVKAGTTNVFDFDLSTK